MKKILQIILALFAKITLRRFKPIIIGITGSVGKTSTREAVFAVLKNKYRTRQAEKNYNNELGLPLTVLGLPHYGKNIFGWALGFIKSIFLIPGAKKNYPEILLLEYGVDKLGDMDYLLNIAKPKIAVVTAIGDLPMHVENFKNPEEVVLEKAKLVKSLPENGLAILNHDDYAVYDFKDKTKAKIVTFGFEEKAEIKAINYELKDDGMSFKINHRQRVVPVRIRGALGLSQVYACLAAASVGIAMDINLIKIAEALAEWTPPPGRLRLLKGIKNTLVLDDTYNAGPESTRAALDTLLALPGKRKIAILGDMLELGKYTEQAHRSIGDAVAKFADFLITVGVRAGFIAEEANARGLEHTKILKFADAESVEGLDMLLQEGDLILVKGSQGIRMEKIVEQIMGEPERSSELLVRQEACWKKI